MGQKKRSPGQGLKLLLIRDYLYNEATKEYPKNSKDIIAHLAEHDIKASVTTIHTDIMRLREDLGIPIEYNRNKFGYYIAEKPFSPAELRLMIDCIRNAEFLTKEDTSILVEKVKGLASLPDKEMLTYQLEEEYRKSQTNASVIDNISLLFKAIGDRKKVSFNRYRFAAKHTTHTELDARSEITSPIKLIRESNEYSLECITEYDNCIRFFESIPVSMMTNVKILPIPATYTQTDKQFRKQTIEEADDYYYGKRRAITIQFFTPKLSDTLLRKLPEDAILIKVNRKWSQTTIIERASPKFFLWISEFGTFAKILEPQDVIERFIQWQKQKLDDYARLYKVDLDDVPAMNDNDGRSKFYFPFDAI